MASGGCVCRDGLPTLAVGTGLNPSEIGPELQPPTVNPKPTRINVGRTGNLTGFFGLVGMLCFFQSTAMLALSRFYLIRNA
jgi:hypothetical protein